MATDPRHNMLLEQMDTSVRIPSFYKGGGVAFAISAVLLGIGGGLYLEWTLEPEVNDMKIYMLAACIIVLMAGFMVLLLVTPVVLCSISSLRTKMTTMQGQVDAGEACICSASDAQWLEFVEEQWGPDGAVRKAQNGPILTLFIGICVGGLGTAFLKFRSFIRGAGFSWVLCAVIMIPVGIIVVFLRWFGEKIVRRQRYAKCKRAKFPIILAPESLYFGGVFVHGKQGCTSNCRVALTQFVRKTPGAVVVIVVTYVVPSNTVGNTDTTKHVTAPIGEECLAAAKAYVLQHRAFYKVRVNATPNTVEIGEI